MTIDPSPPPPATWRPSVENAIVVYRLCSPRLAISFPLEGSHMTMPRELAVARRRPSGENASARIEPRLPATTSVHAPVSGSQNRTSPSSPTLAI